MRTRAVLLLAYGVLLGGITLMPRKVSDHSTSRLATIDSLVERGTFAIDGAAYQTIDKVYINGRYYSHQPPMLAVTGAVVYYPLHLLGMQLGPNHHAAYVVMTFAMNGLGMMVGLVFFFRALRWSSLPQRLHLPLTASLACGTLLLPFSTTSNSHGLCAALMAIGLYYYLVSRESGVAAFWSGLAFAVCGAADHTMLAFYGLFGVCILLGPGRRSRVLWFFLPGVLTMAAILGYYFTIGHSIKPFAARPELFVYPGSQWSMTGDPQARLTGVAWNPLSFALRYGALLLAGPRRGFLIYNPASWLALYGIALSVWRKAEYWREAVAVMVASAVVVGYYALASVNYSGWSYSIRWFIPFLPLWWFFGSPAIETFDGWALWKRRLLAGLVAISVFYAVAGALNPWPAPWHGPLLPLANVRDAILNKEFWK